MDCLAIHARDLERCGRPLTRTQERRLFSRARRGDRTAYETLVHSQLRWVWRIATKFNGKGIALEDLIQIGHLALLRAVEKWKPCKKCRLGTYATWTIRRDLQYALNTGSSVVRLPSNPRVFGLERYAALRQRFVGGSLDLEGVAESVADPRVAEPVDELAEAELVGDARRRKLWDAMDRLDARQQTIVERRLEGATLQEIAAELAVSKERVRQIEKATVRQLIYLCTGRSEAYEGQAPSLADVAKAGRKEFAIG